MGGRQRQRGFGGGVGETHIRDPIHGSIRLSSQEMRLIETDIYQRLRNIRQMGFADQAFPGATHTRFAHSLGAMEMAGRLFDAVFPPVGGGDDPDGGLSPLPQRERARLRQILRLAVLLHDVGHAPLSHATEGCLPTRGALGLAGLTTMELMQRATHEDYSVMLILRSVLAQVIKDAFGGTIDPQDVAQLISGRFPQRQAAFVIDGIDYGPVLGQMVSGELDADRLDYLPRDSFYAGVRYGKFDDIWLLNNLTYHLEGDQAFLALSHRAIFAFEDFLLSRYHMFVSVYYHHTAVGLDTMLARYLEEAPDEFVFPTTAEAYVGFDDLALWSQLRRSQNPWAQRITRRALYRCVLELNVDQGMPDLFALQNTLTAAGVDHFISRDEGVLSRYYGAGKSLPIYVINRTLGQAMPVDRYCRVYERYSNPTRLTRLYCRPDQRERAEACLRQVLHAGAASSGTPI